MKVLKFGGSSMASSDSINRIIDIAKKEAEQNRIWIVVSAMGKTTNNLIQAAEEALKRDQAYQERLKQLENHHIETIKTLLPIQEQISLIATVKSHFNDLEQLLDSVYCIGDLSNKTLDSVVSFGELLSSKILAKVLEQHVDTACFKDSRELIRTDNNFGNAKVQFDVTNEQIKEYYNEQSAKITVLGGFISTNDLGQTTTLGRGGSDYSAAIYAAALDAELLEIWTDVSGMYSANPTIVSQAFPINKISYQEAMELSHFGAKVIYPPTIQPVFEKDISIKIKNTFSADDEGTLIAKEGNGDKGTVKGISHIDNISLLTLEGVGMVGVHGTSKRLFEALGNNHINVILITQASSEHSICIAIDERDSLKAEDVINYEFRYEISQQLIDPIIVERNLSIVAVVGDNMKSHQGISGTLFSALGRNNINIRAIAQGASERNISAVIDKNDVKKALNSIHAAFFSGHIKELNLFIAGVGNVGSKLISQIKQQHEFLKEHLHLNVKVVGMANSKGYLINEDGIDLNNWEAQLKHEIVTGSFYEAIVEVNKRNSVFVDITAHASVAAMYAKLLRKSVSVVACNKIACSDSYAKYQELKFLAKQYKASFLYETNVGAGLPIIKTLQNLIASGDQVTEMQAVLSGSLNFIFNNYSGENKFHDVVKQAQDEGYTEPDPRIDLSGVDVARKILILVREAGNVIDFEEIENIPFLPEGSIQADGVPAFYDLIGNQEAHFKQLIVAANEKECKLKYVASYKDGKAKVKLEFIPKDHPFYNLEGKDNIVSFYTNRYQEQPLIVKGAGAGADVTASGLFADIIQIGSIS